jgi:hypothetical protein
MEGVNSTMIIVRNFVNVTQYPQYNNFFKDFLMCDPCNIWNIKVLTFN